MRVSDKSAKDYTGPGFDPVTRELAADLIDARAELSETRGILSTISKDRTALVDRISALEAEYKGFRDSASDTYKRLAKERIALEAALIDYRDHGLRFDLNPTHDLRYASTEAGRAAATFWHAYIKDMDETVRQRARNALTDAETTVKSGCTGCDDGIPIAQVGNVAFHMAARHSQKCTARDRSAAP